MVGGNDIFRSFVHERGAFLGFFPSSNKFNGFHIYNTLVSQISIENIYNTLVSQISIEKRQYCVNLMCSSCGNRQIIIIIIILAVSSDFSVSCRPMNTRVFPSIVSVSCRHFRLGYALPYTGRPSLAVLMSLKRGNIIKYMQ